MLPDPMDRRHGDGSYFRMGVQLGLIWAIFTKPLDLPGCLLLLLLIIVVLVVGTLVALFEWWLVPAGLVVLAVVLIREQRRIEQGLSGNNGKASGQRKGRQPTRR